MGTNSIIITGPTDYNLLLYPFLFLKGGVKDHLASFL